MPALTSNTTRSRGIPAFRFFLCSSRSLRFFYPEAGRAYLQIRGAHRSCCLRARGVLHPGRQPWMGGPRASRDTGTGIHAGELNVFPYTFSVTIIYTSDMCRSVSPKKRPLYARKRRCALGESPGRMTVTPSSAPLSGRSGVGRVKSGAKTQSIRRLYELPSIVWAW